MSYIQYFLLLLARALQNSNETILHIDRMRYMCINDIRYIEDAVDEFINVSNEIKKDEDMLEQLGFDVQKLDEIFDEKLVPFLQNLKADAKKQIAERSESEKSS